MPPTQSTSVEARKQAPSIATWPVSRPAATGIRGLRLNRLRFQWRGIFARIPHARAVELARYQVSGSAWFILVELDRMILKGRGRNPVQLTNSNLRAAGISRNAKRRALRQLVEAGVIRIVENRFGKAPLIVHLWYPVQE